MAGLSAPEFLDKLKAQLEARSDLLALDPVPKVYTAWPTAAVSVSDAIIIGYDALSGVLPAAIGQNRVDEDVTLDCQIRVLRAGAGEAKAKIARDVAKALYQIVDNECRTNHPELAGANDDIAWSRVGSWELNQFPHETGDPVVAVRVALVEFSILYKARLST